MVERCVRIAKVTSSNLVISTNPNLKRTPFERTVLGFFFFLLQTYSYQILFRHYFGVIQRKTDNIQIPTENNNALKLKIVARRIRADRQAVQRRPPVPVRFEFRFVPLLLWRVLERRGEAEPLVYSSTRQSAFLLIHRVIWLKNSVFCDILIKNSRSPK